MSYKEGIVTGLIIGGCLAFVGREIGTRMYTGASLQRTRMATDKKSHLYLETFRHGYYRIIENEEGNPVAIEKFNPRQVKLVPCHATYNQ